MYKQQIPSRFDETYGSRVVRFAARIRHSGERSPQELDRKDAPLENMPTTITTTSGGSNFLPLVVNFAQREMRARYKRSLLGWFWSLLNPASTVLIYSLIFGVFFQTPPPITANGKAEIFSIYLFTGFITWGLFQGIVNGSMDWLTGVMDLRKKVFFPTETAILGGAIAAIVQTLFEIALLIAIMLAVTNISWTFLALPLILLGAASFAIGIGFVLAILNARFRDVRYLTSIALSLQFFLAPIVYDIAILDSPTIDTYGIPAKEIVLWNPVSQYVQAAHDVVYFLEWPSLSNTAAMLAYALISPVLGLHFFRKRSMEISEEL